MAESTLEEDILESPHCFKPTKEDLAELGEIEVVIGGDELESSERLVLKVGLRENLSSPYEQVIRFFVEFPLSKKKLLRLPFEVDYGKLDRRFSHCHLYRSEENRVAFIELFLQSLISFEERADKKVLEAASDLLGNLVISTWLLCQEKGLTSNLVFQKFQRHYAKYFTRGVVKDFSGPKYYQVFIENAAPGKFEFCETAPNLDTQTSVDSGLENEDQKVSYSTNIKLTTAISVGVVAVGVLLWYVTVQATSLDKSINLQISTLKDSMVLQNGLLDKSINLQITTLKDSMVLQNDRLTAAIVDQNEVLLDISKKLHSLP